MPSESKSRRSPVTRNAAPAATKTCTTCKSPASRGITGTATPVVATVMTLHTFSAHADRDDLLWFMKTAAPSPRRIFLVHGDPKDRVALKAHLAAEGLTRVECPEYGDTFELE